MPAKSKAQQQFMGVVHAYQKGDVPAGDVTDKVKKTAKEIKPSDAKDFASTKTKGLPKKVSKEERLREAVRLLVRKQLTMEVNPGRASGKPLEIFEWGSQQRSAPPLEINLSNRHVTYRNKTFTVDLSDLGPRAMPTSVITMFNPSTGNRIDFSFVKSKRDKDSDIFSWEYKNKKSDKLNIRAGQLSLIIIND